MASTHDITNRPKGGSALFQWILEQRKLEESQFRELTRSQKDALAELKKRNAERGTTVIKA